MKQLEIKVPAENIMHLLCCCILLVAAGEASALNGGRVGEKKSRASKACSSTHEFSSLLLALTYHHRVTQELASHLCSMHSLGRWACLSGCWLHNCA
jgi:hypothetical protein